MPPDSEVVDGAFGRTIDVFRRVTAQHPGTGGQLAIRSRDRLLVSVCSGRADSQPWSRETVANVWSVAKAVAAVALSSSLNERGESLETQAIHLWPELQSAAGLPVAALLAHRLGVVGLRRRVRPPDLLDSRALADELSQTRPWWEPGEDFGYHSWTYGVLVAELSHRIGIDLDEVLGSLCSNEAGASATFARPAGGVAPLVPLQVAQREASLRLSQRDCAETVAALRNPVLTSADANAAWWRDLNLPSVKLLANADGISLVLTQLLGGGSVSRADADLHLCGQGRGTDRVLGDDREFTAGLVVGHPDSACPYSTDGRVRLGHDGMGGSFVCVDPDAGLVLTWVTNGMGRDINTDPRKLEILEAFDDDTR